MVPPLSNPPTTMNEWADFWRLDIGLNVIPADTKNKHVHTRWAEWQAKPIPEELHNKWKKQDAFAKGIAIIPGKVWHREDKKDLYFTFLDADKQKAIDELCSRNGKTTMLQEMAEKFIVEQHKDNLQKAHVYFYSPVPFPKKSADSVLGLEVKGVGEHGIAYCANSIHKDGQPYEIIGTTNPITLTADQAKEIIEHIDQICKKYNLEYLEKHYRNLLDSEAKIYQGERHTSLISIANSLLFRYGGTNGNGKNNLDHQLEQELKNKFLAINDNRCEVPLPATEINQIWKDAVNYYLRQPKSERRLSGRSYNDDSNSSYESISVATAIRRSHGRVIIKGGMIVGVSPVIQVVTETEYRCMNCGYSSTITHSRPLFSIPQYLSTTAGRARQCLQCEKHSFAPFDHKEMSAMVIQLQDDKKQNDLETLTVVLFDNDTLNVKNGEKVIVKGSLHVVQQKNNGKRMTFLFTEVNSGIQKEESQTDEETPLTEQDIAKLNEYSKRPDYIKEITAMFAPTVIGHEDKKLGVILMYVGAPENQDFRGRIHGLFIGPPGLAKTKLAQEARELGRPHSRYCSAEGAASGKSITVIIEKENDTYILRLGVLLQAHGSVCVINKISALPLEEQAHLYGVMEEGMKTIDSYTFHKEIEASTTVLATTNPLRGKWHNDTVSTGQIPLTLPHVDRYDLIFVFKSLKDEQAKMQYAKNKFEIYRKYRGNNNNDGSNNEQQQRQADYSLLRKIIKRARSFDPVLSEEAEAMIAKCWAGLSSSVFATNRVFETIVRVSIAFARLYFSNTVTGEIAKEAIDILTKTYREFDSNVAVVHNPRDAACFEIANFLQENPNMPYDFGDLINHAVDVNPFVEAYLGKGPVNNNNSKYRDIAARFKEGLIGEGFISIVRENPLRLVFKPEAVTASEKTTQQQQQQSSSTSEVKPESGLSPEELQKMPIPDSIERLGHSDIWQCKYCKLRGDIWDLKKHALYFCSNIRR